MFFVLQQIGSCCLHLSAKKRPDMKNNTKAAKAEFKGGGAVPRGGAKSRGYPYRIIKTTVNGWCTFCVLWSPYCRNRKFSSGRGHTGCGSEGVEGVGTSTNAFSTCRYCRPFRQFKSTDPLQLAVTCKVQIITKNETRTLKALLSTTNMVF